MHTATLFMPGLARRAWPMRVRKATVMAVATLFVVSLGLPPDAAAASKRTRIVETACGNYDVLKELETRALGESILGSILDNTLGRIGAALRAAGEASTQSTVVHCNIEVAPGKPAKCLFIARGYWSATPTTPFKFSLNGTPTDLIYLGNPAERLASNPDFALRLAVAKSSDHSALKLQPVYLEYGRHLAGKKRGSRGTRGRRTRS